MIAMDFQLIFVLKNGGFSVLILYMYLLPNTAFLVQSILLRQ